MVKVIFVEITRYQFVYVCCSVLPAISYVFKVKYLFINCCCLLKLRPMSHLRQSRKCDRACRTLRHGASHSRATRFRKRALFYSMRLWRASKTRDKIAGV